MTLAEYTDEIAFQLGGSVLDLEIANDLPRCVNRAFREIKRYIVTPAYMTLPWNSNNGGNRISLKDKNVYSIINVMRPNSYNSLTVNSLDVFGLAQSYSAVTNLDAYMNRMLRLQQMNTISTDLDFVWDAHTKELYVTMNPPYTNQITIAYVPDYQSVEEITEVYWVDFILKLATAYAKQVLGRIRSKYTLNSAQYWLDGDTLLAEAKEEINEIISYLRENADIAFPID